VRVEGRAVQVARVRAWVSRGDAGQQTGVLRVTLSRR